MTIDCEAIRLECEAIRSVGMTKDNQAAATWIGGNYLPTFQSLIGPVGYLPGPQKSDAPYIVSTLAQLLSEGRITEETFSRLVERLIQQVR